MCTFSRDLNPAVNLTQIRSTMMTIAPSWTTYTQGRTLYNKGSHVLQDS